MSGTREKFNAVFLAAVMVLSMVAFSTAFVGGAAAVQDNSPSSQSQEVTAATNTTGLTTTHAFNTSVETGDNVIGDDLSQINISYRANFTEANTTTISSVDVVANGSSRTVSSTTFDQSAGGQNNQSVNITLGSAVPVSDGDAVNVTLTGVTNPLDAVTNGGVNFELNNSATANPADTVSLSYTTELPNIDVEPSPGVAQAGSGVQYTATVTDSNGDAIQDTGIVNVDDTDTELTDQSDGTSNIDSSTGNDLTLDTDANGEATTTLYNTTAAGTGVFDVDFTETLSNGQNSTSVTHVASSQDTAFIDGEITDDQLPFSNIGDVGNVSITIKTNGAGLPTTIVDEVKLSNFDNLAQNNQFVRSANFQEGSGGSLDSYTINLETQQQQRYTFIAEPTGSLTGNFAAFDGPTKNIGPGQSDTRNIRLERLIKPADINVVDVSPSDEVDIDQSVNVTVEVSDNIDGSPLADTNVEAEVYDNETTDAGNVDNYVDILINGSNNNVNTDTNDNGQATFEVNVSGSPVEDIERTINTELNFTATENTSTTVRTSQELSFVPEIGDTGTLSGSVDVINEDIQLGTQSNIENKAGVEVHAVQFDRVLDNTVQVNETNSPGQSNVSNLNVSNETKLEDIGITDFSDSNVSFTTGDVYDSNYVNGGNETQQGDVTLTQGEAFRVVVFSEGEPVVQDPRSDYLTHTPEGVELTQNETDRTVEVFTDNGTPVSFDVTPLSPSENYQIQQKVVIENTSTDESATFYQNITVDTDLSGANSFQASPDDTFEATEDLTYTGTKDRYGEDDRIIPTDVTNEQGNYELLNLPVNVDGSQKYAVIAGGDNTSDSTTAYGFANFRGFDIVDVSANTNPEQLDTDLSVQEFTPVESITVDLDVTVDDGDKTTRAPVGEAVSVEVSGTQSERGVDDESSPAQGLDVELEALDSSIGEFTDSESDTVDVTLDENGEASVFFTGTEEGDVGETNISAGTEVGTQTFDTEGGQQAEIDIFTDIEVTGDVVNEEQDNIPGSEVFLYNDTALVDAGLEFEDLRDLNAEQNSTLVDTAISGGSGSYVFTGVESGQNLSIYAEALDNNNESVSNNRELGDDVQSSLGGEDIVITGASPDQPLEPANFEVSDLEPEEATIQQGDDLTVSANITNTGGIGATQSVDLAVESEDGTTILLDSTDVTLEGEGGTTPVEFTVENVDLDAGDYTHSIATSNDEATGSLTVTVEDGGDGSPPADDRPASLPDAVSTDAFNAVDTSGDSELSPGEIAIAINDNSDAGNVDGVEISPGEFALMINWNADQ